MRHNGVYMQTLIVMSLTFILILFAGCQKEEIPENSHVLFSVDLPPQLFSSDRRDAYLAAYTSDGKLINYGRLTDSSKWELKGKIKEDKIDILYILIQDESLLRVDHIKDIPIGQSFEDSWTEVLAFEYFLMMLKVEDFGNHRENTTSQKVFEMFPRNFNRGSGYSGEFEWSTKEDGYTYKTSYISFDPRDQGAELLLFERGTNQPFVCYLDIPATNLNPEDTITVNKSDFIPGQLKTVAVNSSNNEFDYIFLYTYNTPDGKKDLITSCDQVMPKPSGEKQINYITSDILPINKWFFRYMDKRSGGFSYLISSNKDIPSLINIDELTGHKTIISGLNQFNFTHSTIFPGKQLVKSTILFTKGSCNNFQYSLYFDENETNGTYIITPFEIPREIITRNTDFLEIDDMTWNEHQYSHTYTNISNSSPLEFLKARINLKDGISSEGDFYYEEFIVNLYSD